jgi:hypothetical protein
MTGNLEELRPEGRPEVEARQGAYDYRVETITEWAERTGQDRSIYGGDEWVVSYLSGFHYRRPGDKASAEAARAEMIAFDIRRAEEYGVPVERLPEIWGSIGQAMHEAFEAGEEAEFESVGLVAAQARAEEIRAEESA